MATSTRKLAAIMFTDIVGYTALMGSDESEAFGVLETNRQIHKKYIEKYHGRLLKELGDGVLSCFETGTEAVLCAIEIQKEANRDKIPLRIGIHEGEVIFENNDVFGDGVNIASRIQDEATKGGICISDSVYRIIKNKTDINAVSIGTRHLKNVSEDIKLYQIKAEGIKNYRTTTGLKKSKVVIWSSLIFIFLLSGLAGWFINEKTGNDTYGTAEKYNVFLPQDAPLICPFGGSLAISPDGTLIVYQAYVNEKMYLYKKFSNEYNATLITESEGGQHPFFSPDGQWIGFNARGKMKKVHLTGGRPEDLCNVLSCSAASWSKNDIIVFGIIGEGLKEISTSGGQYTSLTSLDLGASEWIHTNPHILPDGSTVLYSVLDASDNPLFIKSINLKTKEERIIIENAMHPLYIPSGYLIYIKDNHLMASSFDVKRLRIKEPAVVLIENVAFRYPSISLSNNGFLVYIPEKPNGNYELLWLDMRGNKQTITTSDQKIWGPRISPDGNKIAMWISDQSGGQVYIYNLFRESMDRLTNKAQNYWPVWSSEGKYIAFPSIARGSPNLYWKPIDKSNATEPMIEEKRATDLIRELLRDGEKVDDYVFQPQMWTANGKYLLFVLGKNTGVNWDIMAMDMTNQHQILPFISTEYSERCPRLSPDDQWLAFQTDESGKYEIYATRFPDNGAKWKISVDGGIEPIWAPNGKRIYYRHENQIMAVEVETKPQFNVGRPEVLFSGNYLYSMYGWYYDIHPDDDRFVMVQEEETDPLIDQIYVIRNISADIKSKFALNP